ncbi:MAG: hypothetical protein ACRC7G_15675 [Beijerinckiaceae bacterium]
MCDYSLHHVASTPAKVGDKIVSSAFPMSSTRGFTVEGQPNVAVCILPGTELAFEREVECDRAFGFLPRRKTGATVARFREVNPDQPHAYHDALEFPDGQIVLVTHLALGQKATVLQLPATARDLRETPAQVQQVVQQVVPPAPVPAPAPASRRQDATA